MNDKCDCGGACTFIFPCSGGSDVGEISDKLARHMGKSGKGKMYCLAGIGGHVSGIVESTKSASRVIAIDGCPVSCAKKTLEHIGVESDCFNLKDYGFEKGKVDVSSVNFDDLIQRLEV